MAVMQTRRLRVWQDKIDAQVAVRGSGPPLLYLHGPWGLRADADLLDRLARDHTVYAPQHPGTGADDPDAVHQLDNLFDLVVYYGELLDRLNLASAAIVGHSFGGMVAAEIACTMRERVSRLVLIDPVGLWRDDLPVTNWMLLSETARRPALFAEPDGEVARAFYQRPEDLEARADVQAAFIWAQACTGKFVWPIPDKGLKKHLHRIAAPTLVIWGQQDRIASPAYAQEFASRIANARTELVGPAG